MSSPAPALREVRAAMDEMDAAAASWEAAPDWEPAHDYDEMPGDHAWRVAQRAYQVAHYNASKLAFAYCRSVTGDA